MLQFSLSQSPRRVLFLLSFWALVFMLNVGPEWHKYGSPRELIEVVGSLTLLQWMVSWIAMTYLVPRWLDPGQVKTFVVLLFLTLLLASEINILISYFYLEQAYPETYGAYYLNNLKDIGLVQRLGFSYLIKYILFSKLPSMFFPAAILIAVSYYQKQQLVLQLREQKQAAELGALKNQLNPHFIFNTLNNIYALAIQRSMQTAEAVAKLSGILDYVLYRCNEKYVSLGDEATMIEDYIALEKLRFGDRLNVHFSNKVTDRVKVAPLLFLTLIENAFKHGASQELRRADINLVVSSDEQWIEFEAMNSKPVGEEVSSKSTGKIGLANLRRQLDLLYPNAHQLNVAETEREYRVSLKLEKIHA